MYKSDIESLKATVESERKKITEEQNNLKSYRGREAIA
jgi:hypothetical protein